MKKKCLLASHHDRSNCPVACALDLFGDKWTLLLIRDMFLGKSRYGEFLESAESIPTNILVDRLNRLLEAGVIEKEPYQDKPVRYAYKLTDKGRDLGPIVVGLVRWGEKHIAGTKAAKNGPR